MKQVYIGFLILFLIGFVKNSASSDIVNVQALNSRVIMIHFDDGYVRYHRKGESRQNEWVVSEPLDVIKAITSSNYTVKTSAGYYETAKNPVKVTRKSKGTEFTWLCQNYVSNVGCVNSNPDHAKEHWIYLHLPQPLEMGNTYTVTTLDLAGNGKEWKLDFSFVNNRSEAVHVNLVGYDPLAPKKYGYVYHWAGESGGVDFSKYSGKSFYLIDTQTGEKVHSGKLNFRKNKTNTETQQPNDTPNKNFLGADVYECDFSGFNTPGEYILAVDEIGSSFPFKIKKDIYRLPYYTSIRGLYHNRSGIELKGPFTDFTRPAPHNPLLTPGFSGKLKYTTSRFIDWKDLDHSSLDKPAIEAGIRGSVNTWGWYQDAGDWDGYFTHMKIPSILMLTWEIAPEKFADGELNLPEGVNQIPDILDEARWLIRFFHRTRHEIINKGFGSGGIGSRVAPDWFGNAADGIPSYLDNGQWIISGEDPFTTYFYAGLAGHFALILNKLKIADPDGIDWAKEAREAFQWAKNNTRQNDTIPSKVHNYNLKDFELYAAATLFRLTGNNEYAQIVKKNLEPVTSASVLDEDKKWGAYALITGNEHDINDAPFMLKVKGAIIATADQKYSSIDQRACRYGGNIWFPMLVGQGTTPMVFEMMMGHFLAKTFVPSKALNYWAGLFTTADYFLGCNPLNMAYITHVGVRYPERVLHLDSWYNNNGEMIPGITPYGPWKDDPAGAIGPWSLQWPYKTLYPEGITNWPGHERWFNNYTTPLNTEFTIHQNTVLSAVVYGYLCNGPDGSFKPNKKPSVEIVSPVPNSEIEGKINIGVKAVDPNGNEDIAWVEFYNDWHKIGQSNKAPFQFTWEKPGYGTAKLSAKVVDKSGFSAKSGVIEITVKPMKYDVVIVVKDSITNKVISKSKVLIGDKEIVTNISGEAKFEQIPGILNVKLEHERYFPKNIKQLSVYSDTTLVFYLAQKKSEVVIVVRDSYDGKPFEGVPVFFNSIQQITNTKGEALFTTYTGDYNYAITKNSFRDEKGTFKIESDTIIHVFLVRTDAEIKFVLKEGITPLNDASVIIGKDTILSTALGIARFKGLPVFRSYIYNIYKSRYQVESGTVFLQTDTTVNVAMRAIPVGLLNIGITENLKIWPNPVKKKLSVSSEEIIREINVYTLSGSRIPLHAEIDNGIYRLDFSELKPGTYLLEIIYPDKNPVIRNIIRY